MKLMDGASVVCARACLVTVGQLSMYDHFKHDLLMTSYFHDNIVTHFTASCIAVRLLFRFLSLAYFLLTIISIFQAGIATFITMPLDVVKTRVMNARKQEFLVRLNCKKSNSTYHYAKLRPKQVYFLLHDDVQSTSLYAITILSQIMILFHDCEKTYHNLKLFLHINPQMIRGTLFELHCVGTEKCPAGVRVFTACRYCVIMLHLSMEQATVFNVTRVRSTQDHRRDGHHDP